MTPINIPWKGFSGSDYFHTIHSLNETWRFGPANFILAVHLGPDLWHPVHIGHTHNLADAMSSYDLTSAVANYRITHVHMIPTDNEIVRYQIYQDLVKEHMPWQADERMRAF